MTVLEEMQISVTGILKVTISVSVVLAVWFRAFSSEVKELHEVFHCFLGK